MPPHTDTVICHLDTDSVVTGVGDSDLYPRWFAMPDRIAHAFLDNAIDRLLEIIADLVFLDRDGRDEGDIQDDGCAKNDASCSIAACSPIALIGRERPRSART